MQKCLQSEPGFGIDAISTLLVFSKRTEICCWVGSTTGFGSNSSLSVGQSRIGYCDMSVYCSSAGLAGKEPGWGRLILR